MVCCLSVSTLAGLKHFIMLVLVSWNSRFFVLVRCRWPWILWWSVIAIPFFIRCDLRERRSPDSPRSRCVHAFSLEFCQFEWFSKIIFIRKDTNFAFYSRFKILLHAQVHKTIDLSYKKRACIFAFSLFSYHKFFTRRRTSKTLHRKGTLCCTLFMRWKKKKRIIILVLRKILFSE